MAQGRALFPAAGFLEVLAAAAAIMLSPQQPACQLLHVSIQAALLMPNAAANSSGGTPAAALLRCELDAQLGAVAVLSGAVRHVAARLSMQHADRDARSAHISSFLFFTSSNGGTCAVASLVPTGRSGYIMEPNVLDCSLQLGASAQSADSMDTAVPVSNQCHSGNWRGPWGMT